MARNYALRTLLEALRLPRYVDPYSYARANPNPIFGSGGPNWPTIYHSQSQLLGVSPSVYLIEHRDGRAFRFTGFAVQMNTNSSPSMVPRLELKVVVQDLAHEVTSLIRGWTWREPIRLSINGVSPIDLRSYSYSTDLRGTRTLTLEY